MDYKKCQNYFGLNKLIVSFYRVCLDGLDSFFIQDMKIHANQLYASTPNINMLIYFCFQRQVPIKIKFIKKSNLNLFWVKVKKNRRKLLNLTIANALSSFKWFENFLRLNLK